MYMGRLDVLKHANDDVPPVDLTSRSDISAGFVDCTMVCICRAGVYLMPGRNGDCGGRKGMDTASLRLSSAGDVGELIRQYGTSGS